ncbi:MAG: DUF1178 family protein [Bradyrhizobium sp.]|nr:MAG: DUF1178 family protein [Bradyrhizobium sp.]
MIRYALVCEDGHSFESWFPDAAAYDQQARRGLVACPDCGSARVAKAIMAPAVVGAAREPRIEASSRTTVPAQDQARRHAPVALVDDKRRALGQAIRALRREIEANTDDVGPEFAETARAIHFGEAPERAIRGQASDEEVEALLEDGVGVLPIPNAPDDLN